MAKQYLDAFGLPYEPTYFELVGKSEMYNHYLRIIPVVREVARQLGYAIGLHGSSTRDLDLIAVPWVIGQSSHRDLLDAIQLAVVGYKGMGHKELHNTVNSISEEYSYGDWGPYLRQEMPHGRMGHIIWIGVHTHIDISIAPSVEYKDDLESEIKHLREENLQLEKSLELACFEGPH